MLLLFSREGPGLEDTPDRYIFLSVFSGTVKNPDSKILKSSRRKENVLSFFFSFLFFVFASTPLSSVVDVRFRPDPSRLGSFSPSAIVAPPLQGSSGPKHGRANDPRYRPLPGSRRQVGRSRAGDARETSQRTSFRKPECSLRGGQRTEGVRNPEFWLGLLRTCAIAKLCPSVWSTLGLIPAFFFGLS